MYEDKKKFNEAAKIINKTDVILIGAGAGFSTAAGIQYSGKRFNDNFKEYIEKYNMKDMYSAGFYPFDTQEEKWGYWSKHIFLNRYKEPATELYKRLFELVKNKEYFVITTNVDAQFVKSGFDKKKVWNVQGDYGKLQCALACSNKLYDNEEIIKKMVAEQKDCKIPTELIPKCPNCGGDMEVNIRKDMFFVQDEDWYSGANDYEDFIKKNEDKNIVFLELGVGYNTPTIIRYPFEKLTYKFPSAILVRVNIDDNEMPDLLKNKSFLVDEDISDFIEHTLDMRGAE